jgi:hypothetical protein
LHKEIFKINYILFSRWSIVQCYLNVKITLIFISTLFFENDKTNISFVFWLINCSTYCTKFEKTFSVNSSKRKDSQETEGEIKFNFLVIIGAFTFKTYNHKGLFSFSNSKQYNQKRQQDLSQADFLPTFCPSIWWTLLCAP